MKILLIGGTGNISSSITKRCLEQGHEVFLLNRGNNRELEKYGAKYIICDANDTDEMKEKVGGVHFDVVANFIAFSEEAVKRDVELFHGNIRQYFFISSCTVYQKPCYTTPITEDTPLKNPYSAYARGKIACEMYLLDRYREIDFPAVIVRPSHTYGEKKLVVGPLMGWGVPHWTLVDRILNSQPIVVHGTGRSLWTATHSDDFAYAFCGLIGNMKTIGHQFHITNDEAMTWDMIMNTYGWILGVEPKIEHIPVDFISKVYPNLRLGIYGDMVENGVFDISKIQSFVPGYRTRVPLRDGLQRSIKWYMDNPEQQIVSEESNAMMDNLIASWNRCKWD
jgi:nucleoside-diphosphate-sugar epimerase